MVAEFDFVGQSEKMAGPHSGCTIAFATDSRDLLHRCSLICGRTDMPRRSLVALLERAPLLAVSLL